MEKTKLLTLAVVALLLLNFGTLGFLVLHLSHRGDSTPHERDHNGPADFIIRELNFNETQKTEFMKLVEAHRKNAEVLQKKDRENHENLFNALGNNDTVFINNTLRTLGDTQINLSKTTFLHFQEVRALCTPEQQSKFNSIIHEALRRMAPPR